MTLTEKYLEKVFASEEISGKAINAMIEIAGVKRQKVADENNITLDYLGKICRDERDAPEMRTQLKVYLYKVAIATNQNYSNNLAA